MNQKNNDLNFKKSINQNHNDVLSDPQQIDKIKVKIMDKYGISSKEADRILSEIKRKKKLNSSSKKEISNNHSSFNNPKLSKQTFKKKKNANVVDSHRDLDGNPDKINSSVPDIHKKNQNVLIGEKDLKRKQDNNFNQQNFNKKGTPNHISQKNSFQKESNVDSLLEDIVPNYNQQISIKVDHIDLTFEVQNEKIDTLKEAFIRTLKREKSKKIKIHALNDISFQIYSGEKVGIIGYNGAGKSTLLNVITGIFPPDKGEVYTRGKISPLLSLGAGFDLNFSGRKNIILNGAVLGYEKEYLESKMDEIIEFSELGEFIDIPIKNYSSGMLAKLGFSIATSVNPDILIIDEILGVGDVNFKKKSSDKIRSLMDGGTTVLLVSHSIPQIRELCDKAIWIDNGSLRGIGEVNKVCDAYLKDAEKASSEQLANIELIK
ncbi:ABC transporter ATP-binding protein [Methanobrevibacter sp.]|uniref:ABC transporter ATP-binding protein n=1 Tax=Methanobrevibacter sp. TaxID=66852 RepID=UPI0025D8F750|nr:ABC transporter ATP-binding protein [Methanobrevibacter sp.]